MIYKFNKLLNENNCSPNLIITKFKGAHPLYSVCNALADKEDRKQEVEFQGATWLVSSKIESVDGMQDTLDITTAFKLTDGESPESNVGIRFDFEKWSKENYVLMPAAVYNGNRFESRKIPYPPQVFEPSDMGPDAPVIITDVPRLNIHDGPSKIHQLTRDLATPAIGFYSPDTNKGFWLLANQYTRLGDSGISIEENEDRSKASITVSVPGVRPDTRYTICDNSYPCEDKGFDFKKGDSADVHIRIYFFDCKDIQSLFNYFVNIRKDISGKVRLYHEIPFSSAWDIQEEKQNSLNWMEEYGYYSIGARENIYEDWQIGWTGGLMNTQSLIFEGTALSKQRALENFDFVFNEGQGKSGFFHACFSNNKWFGDNFKDIDKKWHLLRKSSDALYFIIKQFMLLRQQDNSFKVPEKWIDGTRKCADAFVRLWDRYRQLGQFVDIETGDMIVGGSASAGIAPAGLALAGQYFGNKRYIEIAEKSALYLYDNYVRKGITNGGPSEICQCPDSESAFGLLESYVTLFEVTGEIHWIGKAAEIANQCFTWCVSYDFKFPGSSTFGRLNMHTAGAVYANVQNKHGAPGICTLSGNSLFKLYRATGNKQYLELIQEMAHNLPQYLSRDDRPIKAMDGQVMPAGWMSERVEMSDWLEPIGEIFYGSCFPESSNMLTFVEVPGLYVQPDTGFFCAIDHIDVETVENNSECLTLKLYNPTQFKAKVKVFSESSFDMAKIMGQNALWSCREVEVESQSSVKVTFEVN